MIIILRGKEEYYNSLKEFEEKSGLTRKELKSMSRGAYIIKDNREYVMLLDFNITCRDVSYAGKEGENFVFMVVRNHKRKIKSALQEERTLSE